MIFSEISTHGRRTCAELEPSGGRRFTVQAPAGAERPTTMKKGRTLNLTAGIAVLFAALAVANVHAYVVPGSFPVDYSLGDELEGGCCPSIPRCRRASPLDDAEPRTPANETRTRALSAAPLLFDASLRFRNEQSM